MLLPQFSIQNMNAFPQHDSAPCSNSRIRPQTHRIRSHYAFQEAKLPTRVPMRLVIVLFTLSSNLWISSAASAKPRDDQSEAQLATPDLWQSAVVSDGSSMLHHIDNERADCMKRTMRTVAHPNADKQNDETVGSATTRFSPAEHVSSDSHKPISPLMVNDDDSSEEDEAACWQRSHYAFKALPSSLRVGDNAYGLVRRQLVEDSNQTYYEADSGSNVTSQESSPNDVSTNSTSDGNSTETTTTAPPEETNSTAPAETTSTGDSGSNVTTQESGNDGSTNSTDGNSTETTTTAPQETNSTAPAETTSTGDSGSNGTTQESGPNDVTTNSTNDNSTETTQTQPEETTSTGDSGSNVTTQESGPNDVTTNSNNDNSTETTTTPLPEETATAPGEYALPRLLHRSRIQHSNTSQRIAHYLPRLGMILRHDTEA